MSTSTLLIIAYITSVIKDDPKKPKLDRSDQKLGDRIVSLLRQNEEGFLEMSEETSLTTNAGEVLDENWDPQADLEKDELDFKGIASPQYVLFGKTLVAIEKVWEAVRWYPLQKRARNGGQRRREPSCMYNRFKFLRSEDDLKRLVAYEKAGEIKPDFRAVIAFISERLYEMVIKSINEGHILHDSTLYTMIAEIKDEFKIETSFVGSHHWLNNWKRAHRISSRKITRFVSKKKFMEKEAVQEEMDQFVKLARKTFEGYDPLRVYNLDQSGFQKELYTKRTLTETCSQDVEIITSSASGVTHSYTVLPMLRLDGVLHPNLLDTLLSNVSRMESLRVVCGWIYGSTTTSVRQAD
ncbi:hypothetical protein CAEBREN_19914 [Caenorhabditis brenneri]|uniref:HTH CENPB-type domain-containing protein n=1 Tax=Caenorhabditis brenneri TaxID=135651 RepID=G0MF89_CAEBE|nr:hypothetical protein CAEBREN_19914 [Caenorhabditis brenneri]